MVNWHVERKMLLLFSSGRKGCLNPPKKFVFISFEHGIIYQKMLNKKKFEVLTHCLDSLLYSLHSAVLQYLSITKRPYCTYQLNRTESKNVHLFLRYLGATENLKFIIISKKNWLKWIFKKYGKKCELYIVF